VAGKLTMNRSITAGVMLSFVLMPGACPLDRILAHPRRLARFLFL